MSSKIEHAAPGVHRNDGPPRQNARHCGSNHIAANSFGQSPGENNLKTNRPGEKMSQELVKHEEDFSIVEQVIMQGDLSKLNPEQRVMYYKKVCESSGLNPFTRPFDYIMLNGKLTLYAKKDCTEQLRKINGVSIEELEDKVIDDLYIVKAKAKDRHGRTDESTGAVTIGHLKGEAKANAIMKAETKAKRRVTLSICGLGWTDESEVESIPNAERVDIDFDTGELVGKPDVVCIPCEEVQKNEVQKITEDQAFELDLILSECDLKYVAWFYTNIEKQFGAKDLQEIPSNAYEKVKLSVTTNMQQTHAKQRELERLESISQGQFELFEAGSK